MLSLKINEKIEREFRNTIGQLRGTHKGNLKAALEEALWMWIQQYKKGLGIGYRIRYNSAQKELEKKTRKEADKDESTT